MARSGATVGAPAAANAHSPSRVSVSATPSVLPALSAICRRITEAWYEGTCASSPSALASSASAMPSCASPGGALGLARCRQNTAAANHMRPCSMGSVLARASFMHSAWHSATLPRRSCESICDSALSVALNASTMRGTRWHMRSTFFT